MLQYSMGEKFWIQDFDTGVDRLRIHFITEHGKVVFTIVIQYEAYVDGNWQPIVRFDEAHVFFTAMFCIQQAGKKKLFNQPVIKKLL